MTPYADALYFSLLVYPTALAVLLGLTGRLTWRWVLGLTLAVLAVQYSGVGALSRGAAARTIGVVAGYALGQFMVAHLFLWSRRRAASAWAFRAALAAALLPLLAAKILPEHQVTSYVAFLGISYTTFRALDVIICIHDRLIQELPSGRYVAYLLFFPTISSGPIDRYRRFVADLDRPRTRREYVQDLDGAVHHFFRGLLYKFVIASLVKRYWMDPVLTEHTVVGVVSYMYAYTFYLFFDFAGYSAFAISVSYLFGVHTPENFNHPFLATNIADFWNRWHMSLSTWFRDHIYMRFLMTAMRKRWFASRVATSCAAFFVTFVLMGLWHGVTVRYFVYGLYHAALLSAYTLWADYRKRHPSRREPLPGNIGAILVTFHAVAFGLLIFSGRLG